MARRLTEENITKFIISWLEAAGWEIICFDLPQSGTGKVIHPNRCKKGSKNKDSIIPDIVAVRDTDAIFFENKGKFFISDFEKINTLRTTDGYSTDISRLFYEYDIRKISYGIGGSDSSSFISKAKENIHLVDFFISVSDRGEVSVIFDSDKVF